MRVLTVIFFALLSFGAIAQPGYSLKFKIDGWKDTTAYLGNYYGETTYIKDTAKVNGKGEFVFESTKPLTYRGMYFIVVMNKGQALKQFDFIIGDNQRFSMDTRADDYVKYMKVTGDEDNKLFFENMIFSSDRRREAEPFEKILRDSTLTEDKKKDARAAYNQIGEKVNAYQIGIINKFPNTLTAKILKASQPVKIPDAPKKADGTVDSTFQLRWYRQHFFDNFDLAEPGLICLQRPLYKEKINEYLDKLYAPQPDSLTKASANYILKAKKNQETYKYATWMTLLKYQQPEIMGLDEVYVNIFDKYYGSGEMDFWVSGKLKQNLKEHADRLRTSLVGKQGKNLIMQDVNFKPRSMYDIKNKYTVLYIFDPDCGHCKEETPKLVSFYNAKKWDVEVYAVSADSSMQKMRDYIKDMSMKWITVNGPRTYVGHYQDLYDAITTPSLYVLDQKKKIIAKKVPAEKLDEFLMQYEKFEKAKAAKSKPPAKS